MPINESAIWEPEVREVATGDPVAGGPTGPVNLSLQDLANRTQYLKSLAEDITSDLAAIAALVGDTSMNDVLLKINNLSDLPNKATARENLGVSAVDHTHGAYMSKSANLSDVESPATGRQNLGVSDILFGTGAPVVGTGKNGDVYVRTDLDYVSIYKKSAGAWAVAATTTNIPGNAATAALAALATLAEACSGNSATADKWKTARKLNGVNVDGSADATIPPHSAISTNESGYIRLQGSGLIIQWGRHYFGSSGGPFTITFPIAFPNACRLPVATPNGDWNNGGSYTWINIRSWTKTTASIRCGIESGTNGYINWIAIGY